MQKLRFKDKHRCLVALRKPVFCLRLDVSPVHFENGFVGCGTVDVLYNLQRDTSVPSNILHRDTLPQLLR